MGDTFLLGSLFLQVETFGICNQFCFFFGLIDDASFWERYYELQKEHQIFERCFHWCNHIGCCLLFISPDFKAKFLKQWLISSKVRKHWFVLRFFHYTGTFWVYTQHSASLNISKRESSWQEVEYIFLVKVVRTSFAGQKQLSFFRKSKNIVMFLACLKYSLDKWVRIEFQSETTWMVQNGAERVNSCEVWRSKMKCRWIVHSAEDVGDKQCLVNVTFVIFE